MSGMTVVDFLRARLDEDEAVALAAMVSAPWIVDADDPETVRLYSDRSGVIETHSAEAAHIARHDPARVLAGVQAKRAILDVCARVIENDLSLDYPMAEMFVYNLATAYATHPDYQPEWKP